MRTQSKNKQTVQSAENAGDQLVIGFISPSDWLRVERVFWTNHRAKQKQTNAISDY